MVLNFFLKTRSLVYVSAFHRSKQFSTQLNENFIVRKKRSQVMDPNVKYRVDPVVTKLDNELFKSIFTSELRDLLAIFKKYDYEIRIAGGAVRDLLMDKQPTDLDFATTATPSQMKSMFEAEKVRMINMNGEKHGTITPRINNLENFECTTLRIDLITDGRHAEVEFTKDWLLDANRRDLTINAMFLGFDGSVYDYFYGFDDLKARRVAFVGNADTRIKEDFLRILRYFRFYGRIATLPDKHEPETLKIIADNAEGLQRISGERIWMELKKILQGNYGGELMMTIIECGLSKFIGLPETPNTEDFQKLLKHRALENDFNAITLLSSLLYTPEDALRLHERLKFSAFERDLVYFISQNKLKTSNIDELMPFQQMCLVTIGKPKEIKEFVEELLKFHGKWDIYKKLKSWSVPKFPIDGNTLKSKNCPTGKVLGTILNKLKEEWIKNEFKSTKDELLAHLPEILDELNIVDGKQVKKPKTMK